MNSTQLHLFSLPGKKTVGKRERTKRSLFLFKKTFYTHVFWAALCLGHLCKNDNQRGKMVMNSGACLYPPRRSFYHWLLDLYPHILSFAHFLIVFSIKVKTDALYELM